MWGVWQNGLEVFVCVLALRKLCFNRYCCGLPVDIQWPVSTRLRMVVLEAQGGAVLGVVWPLPSGSASGPLRTLNEHFRF